MGETAADSNQPAEPQIFVSYARSDGAWLERLQKVLSPAVKQGVLSVWDDTGLCAGAEWLPELDEAMATARLAILLVSIDFLASEFITKHELPQLLARARRKELTVFWIPVGAALLHGQDFTAYQSAWEPKRPLASLSSHEPDDALVQIAGNILKALGPAPARGQRPKPIAHPQLDQLQRQRGEAQAAGRDHGELDEHIN